MTRRIERGASLPSALHALILLLYGIFLTYPPLSGGYVPSRDTLIHLLWSSGFVEQFWSGDLYPRWLPTMNSELGSPVFFFYPPLPYWITALMRPPLDLLQSVGLIGADPEGWHLLGVSTSAALILSGFTAYVWLRSFASQTIVLLSAIFYMSAPYHLTIDIYQRFAFTELWSFVWLPVILLQTRRLCENRRGAFTGLALAYAALVLTHLPTTLIFSAVPIAWAAWHAPSGSRLAALRRVMPAMALGMGMACMYVVPAMTTQENVSFAAMKSHYLHYSFNFLLWGDRFNQEFIEFVGFLSRIATLLIAVCACAGYFTYRSHNADLRRTATFWLLIGIAATAMTLPPSQPVWDHLRTLQKIQFPWRFLVVLTLAVTAQLALWMQSCEGKTCPCQRTAQLLIALALIYQVLPTLATYHLIAGTDGAPSKRKMMEQLGTRNEHARQIIDAAMATRDAPEYRPRWVPAETFFNAESIRFQARQARLDRLEKGYDLTRPSPRHLRLVGSTPSATWVTVEQFYYPHWVARLHDAPGTLPLDIRPSSPEGVIQIRVPPGQSTIDVSLDAGPEENLGFAISLGSLLIVLATAIAALRKPASGEAPPGPRHPQAA